MRSEELEGYEAAEVNAGDMNGTSRGVSGDEARKKFGS